MFQQNLDSITSPLTYYSLIERVGGKGLYQWLVYVLVFIFWVLCGFHAAMISFFYMNPGFDCSSLGISELQCQSYVCTHFSKEQWHIFEAEKQFQSIVTEFGPYHCDDNYTISLLRSSIFFGNAVGLALLMFYANNSSQKNSLFMCLGCCIAGSIGIVLSNSLAMTAIFLFVVGLGSLALIRFAMSILSQICEMEFSDKLVVTLIGGTTTGSLLVSLCFGWLKNWRSVAICQTLICIFLLIATYLLIEDSPRMLLKNGSVEEVCRALNRIGRINTGEREIFRTGQISRYIEQESKYQKVKESTSFLDLFRYPSIRLMSFLVPTLTIAIDFVYYSHGVMMGEIGFNPVLNQILFAFAEYFGVAICIFLVPFAPRKKSGLATALTCCLLSVVTLFIVVPANCQHEYCSQTFIQMGLVMLVRILANVQQSIILLIQTQFFPVSVRLIAISLTGIFGSLAAGLPQIFIIDSEELGLNPFLLVSVLYAIMFCLFLPLTETLGYLAPDQIDEVKREEMQRFKHQ